MKANQSNKSIGDLRFVICDFRGAGAFCRSVPLALRFLTSENSMKKLTSQQKREIAAIAAKKDAEIDLSDAAEVLDWSDTQIGSASMRAASRGPSTRMRSGSPRRQKRARGPAGASSLRMTPGKEHKHN